MTFPANHDRNVELIRRYRSGEPPGKLAEEYEISRQRVHAIIRTWESRLDGDARQDGEFEAKSRSQ